MYSSGILGVLLIPVTTIRLAEISVREKGGKLHALELCEEESLPARPATPGAMLFLYRDPLCYQTLMAAPARILLSAVAAVVVAIIVYVAWLAFYPLATPLEAHRKLSSFLLSENVATGARTATSKSVPRQLWMTHYDLESIPQHIHDGVEKYAADFDLHLLDDHGCIEFLRAHFTESVVQRFHDIPSGAHKADLFRFCALYISGGVYLDVKTVLRRDLCRLLGDAELLMTLGHHYTLEGCHIGITACSPRHPVIGVILHAMLTAPLTSVRLFYHWNCRTAYRPSVATRRPRGVTA